MTLLSINITDIFPRITLVLQDVSAHGEKSYSTPCGQAWAVQLEKRHFNHNRKQLNDKETEHTMIMSALYLYRL